MIKSRNNILNWFIITFLLGLYTILFVIRQNASIGGVIHDYFYINNPYGSVLFPIGVGLFLGLYALGYRIIGRFSLKLVITGYLLFSSALILTPAVASKDIYVYAIHGRMISVYDKNPYLEPPKSIKEDKFFELVEPGMHRESLSPYPPLWELSSAFLVKIGSFFKSREVTFFLFRLFGFLGNTLVIFLIFKISRLFGKDPKRAIYLYAWNPFILIHFIPDAHNDIWMILFGLLAYYFYLVKKDILIIPSLFLAGLMKYPYLVLIPIFFIHLYRQKRVNLKFIILSSLLSLILITASYYPLWEGWQSLEGIKAQGVAPWERSYNHYSPLLFLAITSAPSIYVKPELFLYLSLFSALSLILFGIFYTITLLIKLPLSEKIFRTILAFSFLGSTTVLPWYLTWTLPFLSLENKKNYILILSTTGFLAYYLFYSTSLALFTMLIVLGLIRIFQPIKKQKTSKSALA